MQQPFLEWCLENGIRIDGVAPASVSDGGRGLVATWDLETDHTFLQARVGLIAVRRTVQPPREAAQARAGSKRP